jgi:hypothetical protein
MRLRRSHGAPLKVARLDADAHGSEEQNSLMPGIFRLLPICDYTLIRDKTGPHNND